MEGCGECHCAKAIHRVQYVVIIAAQARPFEYRRDSNRRRQPYAMGLLQAPHEFGRSEAAVAFADNGNGHIPKLVPREKTFDELSQGLQIAIEREVLLLLDGLGGIGLIL